ncbi:uncharacterized protein LOC121409344 [Lytechinus variegatus]|uniref:uncharacterized protein LOC121409344 n=1 Tax=Lytechinus variegatus TaxID=7654 RepID=UPI001BB22085|nr:uncharacterized protein LOC121409344 [Lytechinus variegatus]XP_041457225.1 uncharacterized protein LOC121409344 [Lytechinus variegatus]
MTSIKMPSKEEPIPSLPTSGSTRQRPPSYEFNPSLTALRDPECEDTSSTGISIRMTGMFHIIFGIATVLAGIIAISIECRLSYYAVPVWAGVLCYITTGIIGIRAYYKKMTKGMTTSYMVMCTCSSILSGVVFVMYINVALEESYAYTCFSDHFCRTQRVRTIVDIVIVLLSFCELAVAITGASLTCCRICDCCKPKNAVNMVYYNNQSGRVIPHFAGAPSGQTMMVQAGTYQPPEMTPSQMVAAPHPTDAAEMTGVVVTTQSSPIHTTTGSFISGITDPTPPIASGGEGEIQL